MINKVYGLKAGILLYLMTGVSWTGTVCTQLRELWLLKMIIPDKHLSHEGEEEMNRRYTRSSHASGGMWMCSMAAWGPKPTTADLQLSGVHYIMKAITPY